MECDIEKETGKPTETEEIFSEINTSKKTILASLSEDKYRLKVINKTTRTKTINDRRNNLGFLLHPFC